MKNLFINIILLVILFVFVSRCKKETNQNEKNAQLLALAAIASSPQSSSSSVCSGPEDEADYNMAKGVIKSYIASDNLILKNLSTNGTLDNVQKMNEGSCQMAIVQDDIFLNIIFNILYGGTNSKDTLKFTGLMEILTPLHSMEIHIIVNKNSGINSIADMSGKKVNIGDTSSGTYITAKQILDTYTFSTSPVYSNDSPSDAVAKVVSGEYDASFYVGSAPIKALEDLSADTNIKLIEAKMSGGNYWYGGRHILAGQYPWHNENLPTLFVRSLLIKSTEFTDINVDSFLKSIFKNAPNYAKSGAHHTGWSEVDSFKAFDYFYEFPVGWNYDASFYVNSLSKPKDEDYQNNFCSGEVGTTFDTIADDLISTINSSMGIQLTELNTTGTTENAFSLFDGTCTFGIIGADTNLYLAGHPNSLYNVASLTNRVVLPLYYDDVLFLVNTGSNLYTNIYNLQAADNLTWETFSSAFQDAKLNVGLKTSQDYSAAVAILSNFEFDKSLNITYYFEDQSTGAATVRDGTIDATFIVGPYSSAKLGTADGYDSSSPLWVLPIPFNPFGLANYDNNGVIPDGTFPWATGYGDITELPRIKNLLSVSPEGVSDEKIADFISEIYQKNTDSQLTSTSLWSEVTLDNALNYLKYSKLGAIDWNMNSLNHFLSSYSGSILSRQKEDARAAAKTEKIVTQIKGLIELKKQKERRKQFEKSLLKEGSL